MSEGRIYAMTFRGGEESPIIMSVFPISKDDVWMELTMYVNSEDVSNYIEDKLREHKYIIGGLPFIGQELYGSDAYEILLKHARLKIRNEAHDALMKEGLFKWMDIEIKLELIP